MGVCSVSYSTKMEKLKNKELLADVIFIGILLAISINLLSTEIGNGLKYKLESAFPKISFIYPLFVSLATLLLIAIYIVIKRRLNKAANVRKMDILTEGVDISTEQGRRLLKNRQMFVDLIRKGRLGDESIEAILRTLEKNDLDSAINVIKSVQSKKKQIKVAAKFFGLAKKKMQMKEFDLARSYFEIAARLDNDNSLYLSESGAANVVMDDIPSAITFYLSAISVFEKDKDYVNLAVMLNNLGIIYLKKGDFRSAIEYFGRAYQMSVKSGSKNPEIHSRYYNNIGGALIGLNEFDEAIEAFKKAEEYYIITSTYNPRNKATILRNIGEAWCGKGEFAGDIIYYQKALEVLLEALKLDIDFLGKEHENVGLDYARIGRAYIGLSDKEKAKEYFNGAITILLKHFKRNEHQEIKDAMDRLSSLG